MRQPLGEPEQTPPFVGTERRRTPRHDVTLPVGFEGGTGITRDVNEYGICLETDQPLAQGRPIVVSLMFRNVDAGEPWRVVGIGDVVRVEEEGARFVVAVSVTEWALPEPSDG